MTPSTIASDDNVRIFYEYLSPKFIVAGKVDYDRMASQWNMIVSDTVAAPRQLPLVDIPESDVCVT